MTADALRSAQSQAARTPERNSYNAMLRRCYSPEHPMFVHYGARGITVCERWRKSFGAFLADMGPRPEGTTLDRKNNDRGYEPDNCRWATSKVQGRNKRSLVVGELRANAIRALKAAGYPGRFIARALKLPETTVRNVISGETWA